jgi:hypothetical protein
MLWEMPVSSLSADGSGAGRKSERLPRRAAATACNRNSLAAGEGFEPSKHPSQGLAGLLGLQANSIRCLKPLGHPAIDEAK